MPEYTLEVVPRAKYISTAFHDARRTKAPEYTADMRRARYTDRAPIRAATEGLSASTIMHASNTETPIGS